MHNAGLTITDNLNRMIDISNRTGLLAKDAAGTIIHDIPNAPILNDMVYGGHWLWKLTPASYISNIDVSWNDNATNRSGNSAITNVNLSNYLSGNSNVKGAVVQIVCSAYIPATKVAIHSRCLSSACFCTSYNTIPTLHAMVAFAIDGWAEVATNWFEVRGIIQTAMPVVYNASIPYISWYCSYYFEGMLNPVATYWANVNLYLQGFLI